MQETPRLLFVHAHPDDESITNGATIAHYVARGAQVQVVTCTLGEEGEVIGDQWARLAVDHADQLGGYRIAELTAALRALGLDGPVYLGGPGRWRTPEWSAPRPATDPVFSGSATPTTRSRRRARRDHSRDAAARRGDLRPQRWLRASRPHPDPRRHHRGGRRCRHRRLPGRAVVGPEVLLDGDLSQRLRRRVGSAGPGDLRDEWIVPPSDGDFAGLGYPDDEIDAVIDDPDALPAKTAALRAHATQLTVGPTGRTLALSNNIALPIVAQEHYVLTAGVAGDRDERGWETDLLAGVDLGESVLR